jgi:FAD/FMN-containing dehydrogenase
MPLKDAIQSLIEGEVYDDAVTLDANSRDASLFEIKPELVVAPKTVADISAVVKYATEQKKKGHHIALAARAAGTDMSGGPLTDSIVLDFKPHFNHVLGTGIGWAESEPGVFYRDFEKETLKKGYILPCYTSSRELCAIGGMVANNCAGEKTLKYGKMENWIDEMHVVFADGNEYHVKPLTKAELDKKMAQGDFEGDLYKELFELIEANYDAIKAAKPDVTKNSAGYYLWNVWDRETGIFNLCKLIVGSQGTLGIITRAKFKLLKPKQHARMLVMFLKDLALLGHLANDILSFGPETFESYDDHTLKLAMRFMPEMAKQMGGAGVIKMGFSFIPEVLTVMRMGGLPKLVLMAEFTGDSEEEVEKAVKAAYDAVQHYHYPTLMTASKEAGKKYWTVRRESFNLLRKHIKGVHTAPFIDDTVVRPSDLPKYLPELNKIMGQYNLTYTVAGHIGNANFHIIPLMDLSDPKTQEIIPKLSREVYDLVLKFKGSITGEHNDGLIRTPYLIDMYGHEIYNLFVKTKKIFDPHEIFNPGKKVHGNLSYAMHHFVDDKHIQSDDSKGRWNITTKPAGE